MDRDAMIAAMIFGGSGGGSGLPDVTSSDNGKVLGVSNGVWNKVALPKELPSVTFSDNGKSLKVVSGAWAAEDDEFIVTFTKPSSSWRADKNVIEIGEAITAKKRIYGKVAASAVSSNSTFSDQTLLLPLSSRSNVLASGYMFAGSYQTGTTTLFVNFQVTIQAPLNNVVYAYIKEVAVAPAPLIVNYTIMGQSGSDYTLSADATLAQIQAAKTAGRDIKAVLEMSGNALELPLISYGTQGSVDYAAFSNVTNYGGAWVIFQVATTNGGASDTSNGQIVPVSTAQMTYDSGTGTLAITE